LRVRRARICLAYLFLDFLLLFCLIVECCISIIRQNLSLLTKTPLICLFFLINIILLNLILLIILPNLLSRSFCFVFFLLLHLLHWILILLLLKLLWFIHYNLHFVAFRVETAGGHHDLALMFCWKALEILLAQRHVRHVAVFPAPEAGIGLACIARVPLFASVIVIFIFL